MTPDEFRRHGHAAIDWIARYMETIEERPVTPSVSPGETAARLPDAAPEHGELFEELLADLDEIVTPALTNWQSPNWFAYFPSNGSPPAILAELIAAGLGQQGMLWATSPAATEIESKVMDWLVDLLDVPETWKTTGPGGGSIQVSASDATHAAIVVARHQRRERAQAHEMVVYASSQAHSSIEKGCTIAGIGHCRKVPVDATFAMDATALEAAIGADLDAGLLPVAVVSTIGTTATTAIDPIDAIGRICQRHDLWHHVDAAYAGTAMLCEEFREHQTGLERVDSYTFNPHKWMLVGFDCSVFWVADRHPLIETMSIQPAYLRNRATESGSVIDYRDWQVPLGRRFRALKLWWVLRAYGAAGIRKMIRHHVAMAEELADRVREHPRLELFAPRTFGLVCIRHRDGNDATRGIAERLNARGRFAVTPSHIDDRWFVRIAIGQTFTEQRHVDALWDTLSRAT